MLTIVASGMIYIAVADLIPGLHNTGRTYPQRPQALLIGLGVLTVWPAGVLAHECMHAHQPVFLRPIYRLRQAR
jgi:zinc and cadmium transporter